MTEASPRPSDRLIPWYIVLFFVAQTVLFAWFTYIAETTHTGLVTDQAYEKGLQYNKIIEKARHQETLGFSSSIQHQGDTVLFSLKDKDGKGIVGAKVKLWMVRPVHDGVDQSFEMKETGDGNYEMKVSLPEKGLWEARVHAAIAEKSYQASERIVFE